MGLPRPELTNRTALLVIDVQKGFDDPVWGQRNNLDAESKIAQLIAAWRRSHRPILYVAHDSLLPASPLHPSAPGNALKAEVTPQVGETIYRKSVNSSFIGTSLEADLRNLEIGKLVIVGLTTNHCVSTTARMAGNLGFDTYVVSDATATFHRAGIDGTYRPAEEVHAAALSDLHGEFATVVDTGAVLEAAERSIG